MRKIQACDRCRYYARTSQLICAPTKNSDILTAALNQSTFEKRDINVDEAAVKMSGSVVTLHPTGVANDVDTCKDFHPLREISIPQNPKVKQGDLRIAESLIEDLSYRDKGEANQILAIALASAMYDPVEELLKRPLSDLYYYVLRLSQMLTLYEPDDNPDDYSSQLEPDRHSILIHQAKFLIHHGTSEVLSQSRRQLLYGDDYYIAKIISLYLKGGNESVGRWHKLDKDDLLERISASAHLHGIDALERLHASPYLFGYEYPPDFRLDEWKQDWENLDKYPPVPFSAERTIAFVRDRFNITLHYPD